MANRPLTATGLKSRFKLRYDAILSNQPWTKIARRVQSTQPDGEDYNGAQGVEGVKEKHGEDRRTTLVDQPFNIKNREWQAGISIEGKNWRWNKTGDTTFKLNQLAQLSAAHPGELLETLMLAVASTTGPDGVAFVATTHPVLASTQSNLFTGGVFNTSAATPTTAEWASMLLYAATQMMLFKDDMGNRVNLGTRTFTVAVGPALHPSLIVALAQTFLAAGEQNPLHAQTSYTFSAMLLPSQTDTAQVQFIAEGQGSYVFQELEPFGRLEVFGPGTEYYRRKDIVEATTRASYNVGLDRWQGLAEGTIS